MDIRVARSLSILGVVVMAVAIIYGIAAGEFLDELRVVLDNPWGRVSLIDLAIGLVLAGAWIGWREKSLAGAGAWWLSLFFLGNLAVAFYVARAAYSSSSVSELLTGQPSEPKVG